MIYSIHTKQFNNTTVRTHAHTTKKFDMPHHLQCLFRQRDRRNNETTARASCSVQRNCRAVGWPGEILICFKRSACGLPYFLGSTNSLRKLWLAIIKSRVRAT